MAAGNGLIEDYLVALRQGMRGRGDLQDLVDEVADHLYTAAERLEALGTDPREAHARALARFGEPRLVASLLTSTPSKGTVLSLFFARRLPVVAALASLTWALAAVSSFFGLTELSGSWDPQRYLVSAALIGAACLLTALVLVGVNIRAKGRVDPPAVAITGLALFATLAALLLAWVVALWMPVLAAAVTWTCLRARRSHAGSPAFTVALAILAPLLGLASIAVSAYGIATGNGMEAAIWGSVAAFGALLVAGFSDIAFRVVRTLRAAPLVAG
ncbi:permease prefix domain 1-containing protein [Microbacterium capsulatum]|uniref:Permease prefix domain 1-containing protein n=1 Tax=Microbacterium capsulatum TaxID=3041921 RepID=A0ABU0XCH9_9MICO|nr:permease prefix domain 1-containing protein [Microbacterium sp. ASV81]MDQ4212781.1 permease prefix domain 1-containing protein [Microbacterium sp. ASV81]